MLEKHNIAIDSIRVPAKRAKTLDPVKMQAIAEDIIENSQTTPVQIRKDGDGYVLVEGLHRLEALRSLGESSLLAYIVHARLH